MTPHASGPSKKLVPSLSHDRTCAHRFAEDDAMTLEIDCSDCSGAQSIDNPRCAAGIVNILALGVVPDEVVLKRYIHVRYRSERFGRLREAAGSLAAVRRIEEQQDAPSDRRCRTCPASRHRLASDIVRAIRTDPVSFCASRSSLSDRLAKDLESVDCPRLGQCIRAVVSAGSADQGGA
mgnify:FL=1